MLADYIPIAVYILIAAGLAALVLGLSSITGPKGLGTGAMDPYESGIIPTRSARQRFPIRFLLVALSFLVFDIEAIFLYPWAVILRRLGTYGLAAMLPFFAILLIGYFYELKKGGFDWE
jgi:NADH-quinone oxidoreductase subunit A